MLRISPHRSLEDARMPNDEESKNPLDAGQHNHSEAPAENGGNETSKPDSIENNNQSKSKRQ